MLWTVIRGHANSVKLGSFRPSLLRLWKIDKKKCQTRKSMHSQSRGWRTRWIVRFLVHLRHHDDDWLYPGSSRSGIRDVYRTTMIVAMIKSRLNNQRDKICSARSDAEWLTRQFGPWPPSQPPETDMRRLGWNIMPLRAHTPRYDTIFVTGEEMDLFVNVECGRRIQKNITILFLGCRSFTQKPSAT